MKLKIIRMLIMNKTNTKNMGINKYNIVSNEYNKNDVMNYSTEKLLQIFKNF
jgi:hypothetical protein